MTPKPRRLHAEDVVAIVCIALIVGIACVVLVGVLG